MARSSASSSVNYVAAHFMSVLLSLYVHIFSALLSICLPFPVPFLSLTCIHIHNQTASYVFSIATRWKSPQVPRQIGWSLWVEGRREGKIKFIHSDFGGIIIEDFQIMCYCVSILSSCVFFVLLFIFFYFLYRLCHKSLIHLLASVFWKLSHVQNAYLYFSVFLWPCLG